MLPITQKKIRLSVVHQLCIQHYFNFLAFVSLSPSEHYRFSILGGRPKYGRSTLAARVRVKGKPGVSREEGEADEDNKDVR